MIAVCLIDKLFALSLGGWIGYEYRFSLRNCGEANFPVADQYPNNSTFLPQVKIEDVIV